MFEVLKSMGQPALELLKELMNMVRFWPFIKTSSHPCFINGN